MAFALVAGAATALSPCALPVLPVVLSAGVTGGRRRPLGVATGLALSFTFAVVALVYVISALGLPDGLLRALAILVLLAFGVSLMVPSLSARVEGWISRVSSRGAGRVSEATAGAAGRDGFWSGAVVGSGLGLVYAPCAGPILAGVITATASQSFSGERLAVALAYGVGSALTFYALMLGGRRLISPLARRSAALQTAMGAVMVVFALAMAAELDTRFQTTIADELPAWVVNPTGSLERSSAVRDDLAEARGRESKFDRPRPMDDDQADAAAASDLPVLGDAPEFTGTQKWFNTAGGRPLTLAGQRGKVVLVDFWTYTCINCIRTLPHLKDWHSKYADDGLVIVGVHTPEFPFERSAANVGEAIDRSNLRYPVAQDNEYATWNAYGNQFWPAKYLIDARGRVRYTHFGEGAYDETEDAIKSLLAEAGRSADAVDRPPVAGETASRADLTPESYLGFDRADRFVGRAVERGVKNYGRSRAKPPVHHLRLSGVWRVRASAATAVAGARLDLRFNARRVFLVMGAPERRRVRLLLDGRPLRSSAAGQDVWASAVSVEDQRLYRLVDLPRVQQHTLSLLPARGVSAYAFTFG